jgi:hypothetical protein
MIIDWLRRINMDWPGRLLDSVSEKLSIRRREKLSPLVDYYLLM